MRGIEEQADQEQGLNALLQGAGSGPGGAMAAFGGWVGGHTALGCHHAVQVTIVSAADKSHADSTAADQIWTMQLVVGPIQSLMDPKQDHAESWGAGTHSWGAKAAQASCMLFQA